MPPGLFPDAILRTRAASPRRHQTTFTVEPGFLQPPPIGPRPRPVLSATLRREGRTWAERLLARGGWYGPALQDRAESLLPRLRAARVGGTWWGAPPPPSTGRAVVFAGRDQTLTRTLLDQALAHTRAARIVLVAPRLDTIAAEAHRRGVHVLHGPIDPWPLIEQADQVHAAPFSHPWLLAAILGRPLPGAPPTPRLVAAALLAGTRYIDPFRGHPISCEQFLEHAALWRREHDANADIACCVGISFWKRARVSEMLHSSRPTAFRRTAREAVATAARRGGAIAVWPSRTPPGLERMARRAGVSLVRIEDGFVRSPGLGADFLPPWSLVLDRQGIYYDATTPSDLETLLATASFDDALLARAAALRERLARDRVTKYNLAATAEAIAIPRERTAILVPGQVADDRSVLLGGAGVRPGLDLLARVRTQSPDAYIIYKPHPDVEAGHREGAVPDAEALRFANQIVRGGSIADLLIVVDEVHTLTSLTGFEAMIRGTRVTTYGQPFYAGWGLTVDVNPPARRTRRLRLDELVAGTMILYPRYIDPVTFLPCGPETVLDRLRDPLLRAASPLVLVRRLQGRLAMKLRSLFPARRPGL